MTATRDAVVVFTPVMLGGATAGSYHSQPFLDVSAGEKKAKGQIKAIDPIR